MDFYVTNDTLYFMLGLKVLIKKYFLRLQENIENTQKSFSF